MNRILTLFSDGNDENTLPWRSQHSDEVTLDDEQAINNEERKVIQWCQQVMWAITKLAKQTVGV